MCLGKHSLSRPQAGSKRYRGRISEALRSYQGGNSQQVLLGLGSKEFLSKHGITYRTTYHQTFQKGVWINQVYQLFPPSSPFFPSFQHFPKLFSLIILALELMHDT